MGLEKINAIRKSKGMTIDELCQRSGIAKGTLSKITAGITKKPRIQTVQAIADALNVSVDAFDDRPKKGKLSAEEMRLVERYRQLGDHGKHLVDTIIQFELTSTRGR